MNLSLRINESLVKADRTCDVIPVLSTVSNLVDITLKGFIRFLPVASVQSCPYLTHLKQKKWIHCAGLLIPGVNLVVSRVSRYFCPDMTQFQVDDKSVEDFKMALKKDPNIIQKVLPEDKEKWGVILEALKEESEKTHPVIRSIISFYWSRQGGWENNILLKSIESDPNIILELNRDKLEQPAITEKVYDTIQDRIAQNPQFICKIRMDYLKKHPALLVQALRRDPQIINEERFQDNRWWKNNRAVIHVLIQSNGMHLKEASSDLKKEKSLVNIALKQSKGKAFQFADDSLKQDKEYVLAKIKQYGTVILQHADLSLKDDDDVVQAAVKKDGSALAWASNRLRGDRALALVAVRNPVRTLHRMYEGRSDTFLAQCCRDHCTALGFLGRDSADSYSTDLRDDAELVKEAVDIDPHEIVHASLRLQEDPAIRRIVEEQGYYIHLNALEHVVKIERINREYLPGGVIHQEREQCRKLLDSCFEVV